MCVWREGVLWARGAGEKESERERETQRRREGVNVERGCVCGEGV